MVKRLFYLFIFFAPFTSFFAFSAWLRLPVIINLILLLFLFSEILKQNAFKTKWIFKEDLYLIAFLVLVWISFLLGFREKRSFNHSLAYTNSILFYFFMTKYIVKVFKISSYKISRIIYWSFFTCSFIIIADFIGKNYFDLSLRNLYTSADGRISNMDYYIRFNLFRVGGVAEEPGHMAIFYNIYFGISLFYIHQRNQTASYVWITLLFLVSHFAMLSNAGIILPIIAIIIIFSINKIIRLKITLKQLLIILGILLSIVFISGIFLFFDVGQSSVVMEEFFNKIFFNETAQYSSSGQRIKQWDRALSNFVKHPIFGHGPGFGVNEDEEGYLSVYLTILADIGIIGFLFFVAFQKSIITKVIKLKGFVRSFLLFCVITTFLHLMIISDFYHAPLWILFLFIQLVYKENLEATQ